jgi:hypothetical protein
MRRRRRNERRGFIILFGWRTYTFSEWAEPVETTCPHCREPAQIRGRFHRQHMHIFFIPMFPISERERFVECRACRARFGMTIEQFRQGYARAGRKTMQDAIGMFNDLRESPADGEGLAKLMAL